MEPDAAVWAAQAARITRGLAGARIAGHRNTPPRVPASLAQATSREAAYVDRAFYCFAEVSAYCTPSSVRIIFVKDDAGRDAYV